MVFIEHRNQTQIWPTKSYWSLQRRFRDHGAFLSLRTLLRFQADDKLPLSTMHTGSSEINGAAESDADTSLTEGQATLAVTASGLVGVTTKGIGHGDSGECRRSSLEDMKASWRAGYYMSLLVRFLKSFFGVSSCCFLPEKGFIEYSGVGGFKHTSNPECTASKIRV